MGAPWYGLVVNAGSSSVKLAVYRVDADVVDCLGQQTMSVQALMREDADSFETRGGGVEADESAAQLAQFLAHCDVKPEALTLGVHRLVHGGRIVTHTQLVDNSLAERLAQLIPQAPLHLPLALHWLSVCRGVMSRQARQVVVSDSEYFNDLPAAARSYALPASLVSRFGLRRHGFHGLAHQAMWLAWCAGAGMDKDEAGNASLRRRPGSVISVQLGSGCSMTLTVDGRPQETSMGFSPLSGLMMATRCGDLDPGLVLWLLASGLTRPVIERVLNQESGLLGVSGRSSDVSELLKDPSPAAEQALALYVHSARKHLGAMVLLSGGVDGIVFSGGVGEHVPSIRARILDGLEFIGVRLDHGRNHVQVSGAGRISHDDSQVDVQVVALDEAGLMFDKAMQIVNGSPLSGL